jgi:hypothetical protein
MTRRESSRTSIVLSSDLAESKGLSQMPTRPRLSPYMLAAVVPKVTPVSTSTGRPCFK